MTRRKNDHINFAALSVPATINPDERFCYEPLLNAHPTHNCEAEFLGKTLNHPLWVSSMTGGAKEAGKINHILAEACAEFGLGMGLGSCRSLLKNNKHLEDFNLRPVLGNNCPFFTNLGIAQIEELIDSKSTNKIHELIIEKLNADGLIIHINPAQEWLQPEGNTFKRPPIETLSEFIDGLNKQYPIIVKEVGQGIGPESLKKLLHLEIDCLEFGAFGGTNFTAIEIMRSQQSYTEFMSPLATFGHNATEMVEMVNSISDQQPIFCKKLIISGGIHNFLDGYYLTKKSTLPALYGMANVLLQHALSSKEELFNFIKAEVEGYKFATNYLTLKI
jgi:isopentenyl-diphosphate delta-isomerase